MRAQEQFPDWRFVARRKHKYLMIFLVLVLLLSVLMVREIFGALVNAEEAASINARNLALVLEAKLGSDFKSAAHVVDLMAEEIDPAAMRQDAVKRFKDRIRRWMLSESRDVGTVAALRYFDANGDELYNSADGQEKISIADRPHFQLLKLDPAAGTVFSDVLRSRHTGRATMIVAKAVRDAQGHFLGTATTSVDLNALSDHFGSIVVGEHGAVVLRRTDNGAQVVRYPGPLALDNSPAPHLPTFKAVSTGAGSGVLNVFSSIDATQRLYAYRKVADLPFFVVVGLAEDDYLAAWRHEADINAIAAAFFLAVVATVLFKLAEAESRRDESEHALRASERRYRAQFEDARAAMLMIDADTGFIAEANPAAERFYGFTKSQFQRMHIADIKPTTREEARDLVLRIRQGQQHAFESTHLLANGEYRPVEVYASAFDDGARSYIYAIIHDVSARRQAEAQLGQHRDELESLVAARTAALSLAKEAAESASRAKSTFLAKMSHELRTPMNAIMGMTHLALRRATDPKQADQLAKVTLASKHLLGLINDILDLSKIEAEKLSLDETPFRLEEVLANLSEMVGMSASERNIRFEIDVVPATTLPGLVGDPMRLEQILINLVGNAIKFTAQGRVSLRVRLGDETPAEVVLCCEVEDTGIGISPEDRERLFKAFEQADGSMTRHHGGTGLGLAISKRLVQLMGGTIGVQSELGEGSTFWFTVRLRKSDQVEVPADPQSSSQFHHASAIAVAGARLLLAEDEPVNQEVSRALLEEAGFKVDVADNGARAVDLAQRGRYDLVLLDLQMPEMNGLEAARRIRAIPACAAWPILALTANAFAEDRAACFEAGMDDFIAKPVDPEVMLATVIRWLSRRIPSPGTPSRS